MECVDARDNGNSGHITALLTAWSGGDAEALGELTPFVYQELRRLASSRLRNERPGHTLQPTALVHEAFLRLCDGARQNWENRHHFLAIASHLMRQILIQHARSHHAAKRGGGVKAMPIDDAGLVATPEQTSDLVALDEALDRLAAFDARKAQVMELRFFGGMTHPEIALALNLGTATVERDVRTALAWLRRELS